MNSGKTVLITGACGGLGQVIAERFATAGYSLLLHVKKEDERAIALQKKLSSITKHVKLFAADLKHAAEIETMFSAINAADLNLYAVINNAGIPFSGMSWKQSTEEWDTVFDVNIRAPWLISRYAIPLLRKQSSARIIYVSSVVAHRPLPGTSAYAASKSALEGLTRAQAVELSKFGITVNCIAPGYFETGMIDAVNSEQQEELRKQTPAGRLGKASELASYMVYLCSEEAAFITGQVHAINGGLYI